MACDGTLGMPFGSLQGMKGKPEVSVVMSVYNGASDLADTIESVLSQDGLEFEFVVVNDGSRDKSGQILNEYAQRDSRIRVLNQQNTGLTRALIRGCDAARGEFIARQDAGDISLPGRLQSQAAILREQRNCVFVSCWTDVVGPKGEFLYTVRGTGSASTPINILSQQAEWGVVDGPTHHSSVMFRGKEYALCGGYRPEFYFGQDWDLWYRLASLGTFCTLQRRLCVCSVKLGSISASRKSEQESFALLSRKALRARQVGLSDQPLLDEARELSSSVKRLTNGRRDRAATNYFVGKCLLDNSNKSSFRYLLASVKEYPLNFGAWVNLTRSLLI
jgi:glycosyltransferase involved in cell wall biosynthesis